MLDFLLGAAMDLQISRAAISATNATAEVAKALEIQRGDVLLQFASQLYDGKGKVVDYSVSYFIPGLFQFPRDQAYWKRHRFVDVLAGQSSNVRVGDPYN